MGRETVAHRLELVPEGLEYGASIRRGDFHYL